MPIDIVPHPLLSWHKTLFRTEVHLSVLLKVCRQDHRVAHLVDMAYRSEPLWGWRQRLALFAFASCVVTSLERIVGACPCFPNKSTAIISRCFCLIFWIKRLCKVLLASSLAFYFNWKPVSPINPKSMTCFHPLAKPCPCAQDVPWAAYSVRKVAGGGEEKLPQGSRCWSCGAVASLAYAHVSWAELISRAKSDKNFAQEVGQAKQRLSQRKPSGQAQDFVEETLDECCQAHVTVQRSMVFITQQDFEREHQVKLPVDILDEVCDEAGHKQRGLLLVNPSKPHREIIVSRRLGFDLTKRLCGSELRANQNRDFLQYLEVEESKKKGKHWKQPLTSNDLGELIAQCKAAQTGSKEEPGVADAQAPLSASHTRGSDAEAPEVLEGVVVSALPTNILQSRRDEQEEAESKKKKNGKERKTQQQKRQGSLAAGELKRPRLALLGADEAEQTIRTWMLCQCGRVLHQRQAPKLQGLGSVGLSRRSFRQALRDMSPISNHVWHCKGKLRKIPTTRLEGL